MIKKIIVYKIWSNTSKIKILEKLVINMIKYGNLKTNLIFLIMKLIIKCSTLSILMIKIIKKRIGFF
jgi:hypothetical protein